MADIYAVPVTRCRNCPFEYDGWCTHVAVTTIEGFDTDVDKSPEPTEPPEWCPLRKLPAHVHLTLKG